MWVQSDIDKLKTAIAGGVLSVEYDGPPRRRITYQNLTEMRALLASMAQDVAAAEGRSSHSFLTTNKGFDSPRRGRHDCD